MEHLLLRSLRDKERAIDRAYANNDGELADAELRGTIKEAYEHSSLSLFYRHALKQVAGPFYEDMNAVAAGEALEQTPETEAVYGYAVNVLDFLLHEVELNQGEGSEIITNRKELAGALGEVVPFTLLARLRSTGNRATIVPASVEEDIGTGGRSSDFIAGIRRSQGYALCRFQAKYRSSAADANYDVPTIAYCGDEGLCQESLMSPDSLARTLVREVSGSANSEDTLRIEDATGRMLDTLAAHYQIAPY